MIFFDFLRVKIIGFFFEYENPKLEYWSITLERLNNDVYAGYIVPIDEYGNQLYLLKDF